MMMAASIFGDFEFPKNKKFKLPKEFATADYGFRHFDEMLVIEEKTANRVAGGI
ncbi:hypothetical protein [Vibrio sp. 10N.261.51.A4]|uniref:hypothetical protein n=1 Tax=Vibrio sp. 10N.261.51.A4 TaxID=3229674 RepID=UPI00354E03E6